MNNNSLLFLLLAMGGSSSGSGSTNIMEPLLYSSNMLPETPRTLLAITSAKNRAAQAEAHADTLAKQVFLIIKSRVDAVTGANKLTSAELSQHPDLKALLDRLPALGYNLADIIAS